MAISKEWINEELYPAVFDNASGVFPEHDFNKVKGSWHSQTYLKSTLRHAWREDKTKINKGAPHWIFEEGEGGFTLIDYVIQRDKVEFIEAVRYLASKVGLEVPPDPNFNPEMYKAFQEKVSIMETLNSYFKYILLEEQSGSAKETMSYLLNTRGYKREDIDKMGLGCIPSVEQVKSYLLGKKGKNGEPLFSEKAIKENFIYVLPSELRDQKTAESYKLTIPYRSGGYIKGFKFRAIDDVPKKYLNTANLDITGGFFNISPLKGDKDLIVVEGELDALYASVNGIENVVAATGNSINIKQIEDAKKKGARKITLCFDYEPGDRAQKSILRALETLKPVKDLKVYVALFDSSGDAKIDPDSFIRANGIEAFKDVLSVAIWVWEYKLNTIISDYADKTVLTRKDYDELRERVYITASEIDDLESRRDFINEFIERGPKGTTKEDIESIVDQIRYKKGREEQKKAIDKALKTARELLDKGDGDSAIDLLKSTDSLRMLDKDTAIKPYSFNDWASDITNEKEALETGYPPLYFARIPQGAITLIAGRPSHGKTTFMFNLMLSLSEHHTGSIYFFSYEERKQIILLKILNCLINKSLRDYYYEYAVHTNTEYLKKYIAASRTNNPDIERGKLHLNSLLDSGRIVVTDQGLPVEDLCQLIRTISKEDNVRAVFCDYIQKMNTKKVFQDMRLRVAHISNELQRTAVDTGLPIILGAQLNRTQAGKASPSLEGLKEAGNLEEDANLVLSIYDETREMEERPDNIEAVPIQIKALKNRDGEVNAFGTLYHNKITQKLNTEDDL